MERDGGEAWEGPECRGLCARGVGMHHPTGTGMCLPTQKQPEPRRLVVLWKFY